MQSGKEREKQERTEKANGIKGKEKDAGHVASQGISLGNAGKDKGKQKVITEGKTHKGMQNDKEKQK